MELYSNHFCEHIYGSQLSIRSPWTSWIQDWSPISSITIINISWTCMCPPVGRSAGRTGWYFHRCVGVRGGKIIFLKTFFFVQILCITIQNKINNLKGGGSTQQQYKFLSQPIIPLTIYSWAQPTGGEMRSMSSALQYVQQGFSLVGYNRLFLY